MVKNFLLVYDRRRGELLREEEFSDPREAMMARFDAEDKFRGTGRNVEIVVLGAQSREDLLRTHGRYFSTASQLVDRLSSSLKITPA
ncbi:hypothetical protein [Salinactinospora qingdaonensis]|uniref:YCII-related domain-containing protein n=1 Tax=Salinactinospora qingdaonensis TaxID=702744 RepID=A0ABP7EZW9_9ACTN